MTQRDHNLTARPLQPSRAQLGGMTAVLSPSATALLDGVSIVLPCHDEEANVGAAVRMACRAGRMNAQLYEVIVVDDGSRDGTNAVATRLAAGDPHVHVVAHPRNRGYGAALRTGIAAARQPWVLLTDADLQFDLVDLARFVPLAADHDLIAGYRAVRNDPAHRRVAATAWNRLVDWTLDLDVRDVDCAFKLVRRDLFDAFELTSSGAVISAELLARSRVAGARICERDVRHLPRNAGRQSGLRPRVVVRASAELLRLRRALA
jgi:glycosyltransferase involved in cell wall biosynthesis